MKANWKQIALKKAELWLSRHHTPLPLKELGWRLIVFVAKCGQSNPVSFALRPFFSHRRLRTVLGASLIILVVGGGLFGPLPSLANDTGGGWELAVVSAGEVRVETQESVVLPLDQIEVSQRYWLLHSGVDLRAPAGTKINPVMAGRVKEVKNERFGYGKHAIVEHENGYETLYAHMSKIEVVEGQEVDTETELGEVGSTGRSSGPHLHIEVHENGKKINPAPLLGIN